jgi:hypothetical protein
MAKGYTKKVLIISLLLVVIAGVVIIVAINRDRIGNQDSGYGAHLRSGKAAKHNTIYDLEMHRHKYI